MDLYPNEYYHIYNRSNNNEIVFRNRENYLFFLRKYRHYFNHDVDTIAYCLMPTHFHFLVYVKTDQVELLKKKVGLLLSSYTKAINVRYGRHGSLFQEHTKSKRVDKDRYLLKLVTYIHQNPIRAEIAKHLEDWEFSSYRDYSGMRNGTLVRKETIQSYFLSVKDFIEFSNVMIQLDDE